MHQPSRLKPASSPPQNSLVLPFPVQPSSLPNPRQPRSCKLPVLLHGRSLPESPANGSYNMQPLRLVPFTPWPHWDVSKVCCFPVSLIWAVLVARFSNRLPTKDTWVVSSSVQVLCGRGFSILEDKCPRAQWSWCVMRVCVGSEETCRRVFRMAVPSPLFPPAGRRAPGSPHPHLHLGRPGAGFAFGRCNRHVAASYSSFMGSTFSYACMPSVCLPWWSDD